MEMEVTVCGSGIVEGLVSGVPGRENGTGTRCQIGLLSSLYSDTTLISCFLRVAPAETTLGLTEARQIWTTFYLVWIGAEAGRD